MKEGGKGGGSVPTYCETASFIVILSILEIQETVLNPLMCMNLMI